MKCPSCKAELPGVRPAPGNRQTSITLEIPLHLAPAVRDALGIGRNRALMCRAPDAQRGLEDLRTQLDTTLPPPSAYFCADDWAALGAGFAAGRAWDISARNRGRSYAPEWCVEITMEVNRPRAIASVTLDDEASAQELAAALRNLAAQLTPMRQ